MPAVSSHFCKRMAVRALSDAAAVQHDVGIVRHIVRTSVASGRLLFLGDAAVGKTALARALSGGAGGFPREYSQTAAPAVSSASVAVPGAAAASVNFICVDLPGGTVFNMRPGSDVSRGLLGGGVAAVAVCFSVDSRESLAAAGKWLRLAPPGLPGVLVGCKGDLRGADRAAVGPAEAGAAAAALGLHYFECSALSGEGVRAPFEWLAGEVAASLRGAGT